MVGSICKNTTMPVNFVIPVQAEGADAYVIGNHNLRVTGQIKLSCDCSWKFTGSMASDLGYDPYNFNSANRGMIGEALTWVGRNRCPKTGATFNIYITGSESLSFSGRINGKNTCCKK